LKTVRSHWQEKIDQTGAVKCSLFMYMLWKQTELHLCWLMSACF